MIGNKMEKQEMGFEYKKGKRKRRTLSSAPTAGNGTWTHTVLPPTDFESASSAIPTRRLIKHSQRNLS